jgi:formate hydrogenlyase subunit 4
MIQEFLLTITGIILVAIFGIIIGLFLMGFDRIVAARMQARIGPPLTQPFTDVRKLFCKETVVPENAIAWMFNFAPVVALASVITILLYLPIGGLPPVLAGQNDLILVLYLLIIPPLALVAGGFASGSPYATVGAQREMVTMIAYEFPLAIVIIAIAWKLAVSGIAMPFTLVSIQANPVWGLVGPVGVIGLLILLVVLLIVTPGELSLVPFDTPEAETELAGGVLVEYSGRNLALFSLTQGVKTVAIASLVVALFFPYSLAALAGISGLPALVVNILFYILLITLIAFISVSLVRVSMTRFRINQVVSLYWIYISVAGLIGLLLVMADHFIGVV